jgi:hypothetical protein
MRTVATLALVLLAAACGPDGRDDGSGGGGGGSGSGSGSGSGNENCSDAAKLIYTVDTTNKFSKFDPATKSFTDLGTLNCPAPGSAQPFSMGVDRNTVAYVLYTDGKIYKVDILNALACTATSWSSSSGLVQFGMGFSSNTAGSTDDTLFVAGGAAVSTGNSTLATMNTGTMQATTVGTVTGWPELTGTGNAELWGWFPDTSAPRVEQINKTNGAAIKTYQLPTLAGQPLAWAFAFWGGDFWIFLDKADPNDPFSTGDGFTTVYQIDGANGSIKSSTPATTHEIVGAGVSTCAPTVIL